MDIDASNRLLQSILYSGTMNIWHPEIYQDYNTVSFRTEHAEVNEETLIIHHADAETHSEEWIQSTVSADTYDLR